MHESKPIPVLAKAEHTLYAKCLREIKSDLQTVEKAFVRFVKNMAIIRDRRLYYAGGFATFEEFCTTEIGKATQTVYRLIAANDTHNLLRAQGVAEEDLPDTERLCREIRSIPAEFQGPVWKSVLRVKRDQGRKATIVDIQTEAVKIVNSDATVERQQKEVLSKIEGVARSLKMGLSFDTLTPDFRRRITVALMAIGEQVSALLSALKSPIVDERAQPVEPAEPAEPAQVAEDTTVKPPAKPARKARKAKTAPLSLRGNNEKCIEIAEPFEGWVVGDTPSGGFCTKCQKPIDRGYSFNFPGGGKRIPVFSCKCQTWSAEVS